MTEKYYNGDKEVTKEEFEKERERIIAKRIKESRWRGFKDVFRARYKGNGLREFEIRYVEACHQN